MIKSYFFIPGNHPRLDEKLKTINADVLIIDLEDSVNQNEYSGVLDNIIKIENKKSLFIRPRLFDGLMPIEFTFSSLLKMGFLKFIIPKFRTINDLKLIENIISKQGFDNVEVILLIENPASLFSLQNILIETRLKVVGLGFGSQDYCNETGIKHTQDILKIPRFMISSIAKANKIIAIDIACMNIKDERVFLDDISNAEDLGFDAKFTIHPNQLDLINKNMPFSKSQVLEAEEILLEYNRLGKPAVFVFKDSAIEPPHIKKYQKIINWRSNYGS